MVISNLEKNKIRKGYRSLSCERSERMSHVGTWRNSVLGRGNSKYKCSEGGTCLASKEVSTVGEGEGSRRCDQSYLQGWLQSHVGYCEDFYFYSEWEGLWAEECMIWLVSLQDHPLCHVKHELRGTKVEKDQLEACCYNLGGKAGGRSRSQKWAGRWGEVMEPR